MPPTPPPSTRRFTPTKATPTTSASPSASTDEPKFEALPPRRQRTASDVGREREKGAGGEGGGQGGGEREVAAAGAAQKRQRVVGRGKPRPTTWFGWGKADEADEPPLPTVTAKEGQPPSTTPPPAPAPSPPAQQPSHPPAAAPCQTPPPQPSPSPSLTPPPASPAPPLPAARAVGCRTTWFGLGGLAGQSPPAGPSPLKNASTAGEEEEENGATERGGLGTETPGTLPAGSVTAAERVKAKAVPAPAAGEDETLSRSPSSSTLPSTSSKLSTWFRRTPATAPPLPDEAPPAPPAAAEPAAAPSEPVTSPSAPAPVPATASEATAAAAAQPSAAVRILRSKVSIVNAKPSSLYTSSSSTRAPSPECEPAPEPAPEPPAPAPEERAPTPRPPKDGKDGQQSRQSRATWWGWGAAGGGGGAGEGEGKKDATATAAGVWEGVAPPAGAQEPAPAQEKEKEKDKPAPAEEPVPTSTPSSAPPQPASSASSSWLNPFFWVASAPPPSDPPPTSLSSNTAPEPEAEPQPQPETPAPTPARAHEPSPVVQAVAASGEGWLSFLARQAAVVGRGKLGASEGGEGGQPAGDGDKDISESMDIDEPSPAPSSSKPPPAPAPEPPKPHPDPPLTSSVPTRARTTTTSSKQTKRPSAPPPPNLVLPTFEDIFARPPRSVPPRVGVLRKTLRAVNAWLGSQSVPAAEAAGIRAGDGGRVKAGRELPRAWSVMGGEAMGGLEKCRRVVVIGVHGWFPGPLIKSVFGEPTGTSAKFASMMKASVWEYFVEKHGLQLDKITAMPLEGEGKVEDRVDKLYRQLLGRKEWIQDLYEADVVFVATHSQGTVASTMLLQRLIEQGHVRTRAFPSGTEPYVPPTPISLGSSTTSSFRRTASTSYPTPLRGEQRIALLAMCGISGGPHAYLGSSGVGTYLQYFETAAARELFEFQDTQSAPARKYESALRRVLDHGVKAIYVAGVADQVVPIYSALNLHSHHPNIHRHLYIDGHAYRSSDFLTNLLVFATNLRNAGIDDDGLIVHLSEPMAGALTGMGHSTVYEERGVYDLACRTLFETTGPIHTPEAAAAAEDGKPVPSLRVEPFHALEPRSEFALPWILRGILENPDVQELFGGDLQELREGFDHWHPQTKPLKDVRKKLEPLALRRRKVSSTGGGGVTASSSPVLPTPATPKTVKSPKSGAWTSQTQKGGGGSGPSKL